MAVIWTPDENQLGKHTITVVISDGVDSQTSSFDVNVVEVGKEEDGSLIVLIGLFLISLVVVFVVVFFFVLSKRGHEQEP